MNMDLLNMTPEELKARMEAIDTRHEETIMIFEIWNFATIIEYWADIEGVGLEMAAAEAKREAYELASRSTDGRFSIPTRAQFVTAILERRAK